MKLFQKQFMMNSSKVIRYLVSIQGADVNHKNKNGITSLMIAAQGYGVDAVKLLLALDAKVGLSTLAGDTALSLAEGSAANSAGESACNEVVRILQARASKARVGIKPAPPQP